MSGYDGLSDISIDGDDVDAAPGGGNGGGEDSFVPAAELKRIAGARMAQESPGDAPAMAPLPGFVWYAPYDEQAQLQEQTMMQDVQQYSKPFPRAPYCFLCDTIDDDENPYRIGVLSLVSIYRKVDAQTLVTHMYRYYETHVRRLNGNKEWAFHVIWDHIHDHDPELLTLLTYEERVIMRMIRGRVQSLYETTDSDDAEGGNSRKPVRTQPCAKAENQLMKMLRMAQQIHEAKRRALKEATGAANGGSNGGGGGIGKS